MSAAGAGAPISIREYAARARARAEGGGWPFGGDAGKLPPMEVRRFRWWEDEAAAAGAEDEEGEVERRMAAKRRKRSVAELFAAVPRVARGQGCGKGKAAKGKLGGKDNGGKGKVVLAVRVKASNGKKKKKASAGKDAREKEKSSRVKAASISISQSFQHSIRKKPKNSLSKKKGNQDVSVLLDRKTKKGKGKSVLEIHKKAITDSVHSPNVCKKQPKASFSTVLDNRNIRCKSSSYKSKHVTFSDGTDSFRWSAHLPEDCTEKPQLVQTSQQPTRESHDNRNTDKSQLVYQQPDVISGVVENVVSDVISENIVSSGVYHNVPITKPKDRTILGNSVDLDHCAETSNSSNRLNSSSLACLSRKVPCQNFNIVNSHLDGNDGLSPAAGCIREQNHMLSSQASYTPASLEGKAIPGDRSQLSQPSNSCLYDRSRSTLHERSVTNYHLGEVHPELLRSGKDELRSINSSTGSHKPAGAQTADSVSACRNRKFSDDYLRLPINSRGEFIKVHPGGTPNSADIFKRHCMGENSSTRTAVPIIFTPNTCTDHVNLRPNHHARQIYTADQSTIHTDPRFTPKNSTTCGMDFRQLPSSERAKIHYYRLPSNKYPCTNQQELSVDNFCSGCIGHNNPQRRLLGMQRPCLSQNSGQNTQHNAETTMRLMGKTVMLGTSAIQCRGQNNETPGSSKQTRAEDQLFKVQGTRVNVFPQQFHGGLVDPPSACRISDGERQPSGNPSRFSFVPAAIPSFELGTSSFRTNCHNQQPELGAANKGYVHPAGEGEIGHNQPVIARQVQSSVDDMSSVHRMHTQTVAPESSLNRRNSIRNFMEERPVPYQSNYLMQQFSRAAQRPPIASFSSGYPVQNAPGLTTQTKFTSLQPLPPSVIPVYIPDYAPPHGSVTALHPPAKVPYPVSNHSAPGDAIFEDKSMRWTVMGSKPEGLEHLRRNCKRDAEKDDLFQALPKKPFTAARKEMVLLPFPERGLEFSRSRPDSQAPDMPICLDDDPEADLRLGNRESQAVRPLKLKPGAKHVLQPSASGVYQESPWPVHSATKTRPVGLTVHSATPLLAPGNNAGTLSTSRTRDAETYRV